jgi:putative transposase
VHITFSTKNRVSIIDQDIRNRLFEYMGGICKGLECNPIQIGGVDNHVHLLCTLSRKMAQMDLLEEVKKRSSKWIKTFSDKYSNFYWQMDTGFSRSTQKRRIEW